MITYEDYINDHSDQIICNETSIHAEKKERRRRRCFDKAKQLEDVNLSMYSTRDEAEEALKIQGEAMVIGSGGIIYLILSSIISWIIQKILDNRYGQTN